MFGIRMREIVVLAGDGIGPEVMQQVLRVLRAVEAPFQYTEKAAGLKALETFGSLLPNDTIAAIENVGLH